jgi:mercuric ion binding protein
MSDVDRYLEAATRDNTRRSYQSAIRHFEVEWGGFLPASADAIARYLAEHAETLALNTLRARLAALAALPLAAMAAAPKTVTLDVQNMICELCPITVKKSLEKVPGVSAVKVDFDKETATVTYDADTTQPPALTRATTNAGYPSTIQK